MASFVYDAQINFQLPQDDVVSIAVFDQTGRLIEQVLNQEKRVAGNYYIRLNSDKLTGGVNYVILQSSRERLVQKVIVIKDGRLDNRDDDD